MRHINGKVPTFSVAGTPRLTSFLQPRRRAVRQRSGFKVSGGKTGSECLIYKTDVFKFSGKKLFLSFFDPSVKVRPQFSEKTFLYGVGVYIRSSNELLISGIARVVNPREKKILSAANHDQVVPKNTWTRIGFQVEGQTFKETETYRAEVRIAALSKITGTTMEIFGFQAGPIDHYFNKQKYKVNFYEKTELYKPEIYYLPYKDPTIRGGRRISDGFLIGKSCNRCARMLPIDIENELNPLGFSNHCKKRAPCKHNAFSRYSIENPALISVLPKSVQNKITQSGKHFVFPVHFGFQLECRSCKKFEVNAPLNPLRNKAEHHEDGARRRAFERMIIELTGKDVIKNYRVIHGEEFQDYIWEKFGRSCFACGKPLPRASDMDIDHTLPLAYLWPLDATATSLCKTCNSLKHESFPSEFALYTTEKLKRLSRLTGIPLGVITDKKRIVNPIVAKLLIKNSTWLFDNFLARKDYQKVKKGKKVSDLVYKALQKILSPMGVDLVQLYFEETGKYPKTITLK